MLLVGQSLQPTPSRGGLPASLATDRIQAWTILFLVVALLLTLFGETSADSFQTRTILRTRGASAQCRTWTLSNPDWPWWWRSCCLQRCSLRGIGRGHGRPSQWLSPRQGGMACRGTRPATGLRHGRAGYRCSWTGCRGGPLCCLLLPEKMPAFVRSRIHRPRNRPGLLQRRYPPERRRLRYRGISVTVG